MNVKRERAPGDTGMSLVELVVTMMLMSIAMALFTTVALQMYRVQNDTLGTANAQSQVNVAFTRLDREIRYAAGISLPSASNVEFVRADQPEGPTCEQLRLAGTTLELRSWPQGNIGSATPWRVLVADVNSVHFDRAPEDAGTPLPGPSPSMPVTYQQQLSVDLWVQPSGSPTTKEMHATFTASNTSLGTSSDYVCSEGRS